MRLSFVAFMTTDPPIPSPIFVRLDANQLGVMYAKPLSTEGFCAIV